MLAKALGDVKPVIAYLATLLEEGNPKAFAAGPSPGDVARAKGMSQIARDAGLLRESLYKALSGERNPELGTVMGVVQALALKLTPARLHSRPTNDSGNTPDQTP